MVFGCFDEIELIEAASRVVGRLDLAVKRLGLYDLLKLAQIE